MKTLYHLRWGLKTCRVSFDRQAQPDDRSINQSVNASRLIKPDRLDLQFVNDAARAVQDYSRVLWGCRMDTGYASSRTQSAGTPAR